LGIINPPNTIIQFMEEMKNLSETIFGSIVHWVYTHMEYTVGVPLAVISFNAGSWSHSLLNILGRMTLGVAVGVLTAFAVTVYKVKLEKKVIKWLEKKKASKKEKES